MSIIFSRTRRVSTQQTNVIIGNLWCVVMVILFIFRYVSMILLIFFVAVLMFTLKWKAFQIQSCYFCSFLAKLENSISKNIGGEMDILLVHKISTIKVLSTLSRCSQWIILFLGKYAHKAYDSKVLRFIYVNANMKWRFLLVSKYCLPFGRIQNFVIRLDFYKLGNYYIPP